MKLFLPKTAFIMLIIIGVSACTSVKGSRGYIPDEKMINAIRIDVDTKASVEGMLGNPTMKPTFDDNVWYYYSKRSESIAFFKEKVIEMNILAIGFDEENYVSKIKHYTVADNKVIDPVSKKTVTHGKDENFIVELFGNIGRFGAGGGRPQTGN